MRHQHSRPGEIVRLKNAMSKTRIKSGSDPRCYWCKTRIPLRNEWKAQVAEIPLPFPSGVDVCGLQCPKRPEDALVYDNEMLTIMLEGLYE